MATTNQLSGMVGRFLPAGYSNTIDRSRNGFPGSIRAVVRDMGDNVTEIRDNGGTYFYAVTDGGYCVSGNGYVFKRSK